MQLPDAVEVTKKRDITLECSISDPRAKVDWYKDGEKLEVGESISQKYRFNISWSFSSRKCRLFELHAHIFPFCPC